MVDSEDRYSTEKASQSVPLMIKWRCFPELAQIHGFRSVEVLLDTPPGSPKNCPEAKGGSVRVQISPSRPVSVYMVKAMFCPSRDQSSPLQSGFWQGLPDQPAAYRGPGWFGGVTVGVRICVILDRPEVILKRGRVIHLDIQRGGCSLAEEPAVELVPFLIVEHVCVLVSQDVAVDKVEDVDVLRFGCEVVCAEINPKVSEQWSKQAPIVVLLLRPSPQRGLFLGEHLGEKVAGVCSH
ncbi:hypothetical protein DY000_02024058 [Brassica cretica]|uniref:Uncharacterized protein n=1 Tax=Brassica cretica TaxID=69181 RepID=A0ABQ7EF89_BRACR|nr:hypothetical protein DY000_02024058 [Brassica cretica]